jgi:hypothetical protein
MPGVEKLLFCLLRELNAQGKLRPNYSNLRQGTFLSLESAWQPAAIHAYNFLWTSQELIFAAESNMKETVLLPKRWVVGASVILSVAACIVVWHFAKDHSFIGPIFVRPQLTEPRRRRRRLAPHAPETPSTLETDTSRAVSLPESKVGRRAPQ